MERIPPSPLRSLTLLGGASSKKSSSVVCGLPLKGLPKSTSPPPPPPPPPPAESSPKAFPAPPAPAPALRPCLGLCTGERFRSSSSSIFYFWMVLCQSTEEFRIYFLPGATLQAQGLSSARMKGLEEECGYRRQVLILVRKTGGKGIFPRQQNVWDTRARVW